MYAGFYTYIAQSADRAVRASRKASLAGGRMPQLRGTSDGEDSLPNGWARWPAVFAHV